MKYRTADRALRQLAQGLGALLFGGLGLTACDDTSSETTRVDAAVLPDAAVPDDAGPVACGEPPVSSGDFTRAALLASSASCATYHFCQFASAAASLRDATSAHVEAATDETRDAARDAWREAMGRWSVAELFQFGPAASRTQDEYHGQAVRSLIYAWPNTSRCRVEEQLALETYTREGVDKVFVNGRGLYAIEYGLFYEPTDATECLASSATGMAWPTLSADELSARKARYTLAVAEDVWTRGYGLHQAFRAEGGNFEQTLRDATGYPSEQEALNVIAWSLVYIEKEVKDWKVGIPAGYTTMAPVSGPESPFAQVAIENIRANLRGFRALFEGCGPAGEGLGFDDWLTSAGHGELAADIVAAWQNARDVADAAPALHTATAEQLEALYRAVKGLTDLLKNDLFGAGSPINLKLPSTVEGDTD